MPTATRKPLLVNLTWAAVLLLVALPVFYVVPFGPACWLTSQTIGGFGFDPHPAMVIYWPLGRFAAENESRCGECLSWWITLGVKDGESAVVPVDSDGHSSIAWGATP